MANSVRPAPIRPAMPTTSPRRTWKSTFLIDLPLGMQRMIDRPVLDLEHGLADLRLALGKAMGEIAVDHAADDAVLLIVSVRQSMRLDRAAVAQHRDAVGDRARPRSACARSGSRRCPARGIRAGRSSSAALSALVQARGRLVQDQQLHLLGQRLGDLDQLLLADAEIGDQRVRRFRRARPCASSSPRARVDRVAVDDAEPRRRDCRGRCSRRSTAAGPAPAPGG